MKSVAIVLVVLQILACCSARPQFQSLYSNDNNNQSVWGQGTTMVKNLLTTDWANFFWMFGNGGSAPTVYVL